MKILWFLLTTALLLLAGCQSEQAGLTTAQHVGLGRGDSLLGAAASWGEFEGRDGEDTQAGVATISYDYFLTDDLSIGGIVGGAYGDNLRYWEVGGTGKLYNDELLDGLKVTTFGGYGFAARFYEGEDVNFKHGPIAGVLRPLNENVLLGLTVEYEMIRGGGAQDEGIKVMSGIGYKF